MMKEIDSYENPTIEGLLFQLEKYGSPRLSKMGNEWYATVETIIRGEGVSFEVKSDFDHATALEALVCCHYRLNKAIETIKNTK